MPTQSKHASINIGLIQAREALMTQFRPILNQANITDQQWRIIRRRSGRALRRYRGSAGPRENAAA